MCDLPRKMLVYTYQISGFTVARSKAERGSRGGGVDLRDDHQAVASRKPRLAHKEFSLCTS